LDAVVRSFNLGGEPKSNRIQGSPAQARPLSPVSFPLTGVLLDRDGVINSKAPDGEYITKWEEFDLLPGAIEAIRSLRSAGLKRVVVTNQRGVARGRMSAESVDAIHSAMVRSGIDVDAIYYCPHDDGECDCRKPRPGMLIRASRDIPGVTLDRSTAIVGDSETDMEAGRSVGLVLVKIGLAQSPVDYACASLAEAAEWLIDRAMTRTP
jgi:D-glycero-D-manno-heptose 1,7-bisphosphate phosphatase